MIPLPSKHAQRTEARRRLALLTAPERTRASARIAARLGDLPAWRAARTVALYAPLSGEPDPGWPDGVGKRIAFPRVVPLPEAIELRRVDRLRDLLSGRGQPGWSLAEPPGDAPAVDPAEVEAVLVPGLAFDRAGRRLGRGGGYYDRLLARFPAATLRIGIFFAAQELAQICEEPHDRRLDMIVTETDLLEIPRAPALS